MTDAARSALAQLAPIVNRIERKVVGAPSYDMLSDALIWAADEFPAWNQLRAIPNRGVIRILFHVRTRIILGEPIEAEWQEIWDHGLERFPDWPGFEPGRRSATFGDLYHELSADSKRELAQVERELDGSE